MRRTLVVVALGLCCLAALPGLAVERLSLSHVRQISDRPPTVRLYLDATQNDGEPLRGLGTADLRATLGAEQASVKSLRPFEDTGEGTAYIFLVDISKSLTEAQFSQIRDALEGWILDFSERDWGAVVAFGETSRVVVDFTSDRRQLRDGLETLGPTDGLTLFHQALDDAIELSRRRDSGMPGRRVVVVLTDGKDEGSGLSLEDVLARLREHPVPIHAIGYSRLRPEPVRQQYLDVLQRLASNSGGSFFESRRTDFADAYAAIRKAIRRVWVADVACPGCRADGSVYRLQTHLAIGSRVLTRGTDLRLLPLAPGESTMEAGGEGEDPAAGSGSSEAGLGSGTDEPGSAASAAAGGGQEGQASSAGGAAGKKGWWQGVPWWVFGLTALLLALLVAMLTGLGKGGEEGSPDAEPAEEGAVVRDGGEAVRPAPDDPSLQEVPPIPLGLKGVGPTRPRTVRLVVVRGSRKGKEYRLTLEDRAVVGARSTCDCVLAEEEGIAAEQFELVQENGQILLRNLAPTNPTRMGGHAVQEPRRLRSNDLVGTASTILRVVLEA